MKKFFKALALVLALALVIGVVPAQATSAKIKAKKTLYVDGAKGTSTDGTKTSSYKERVAIYKLAGAKKADKEDHKFTAKIKSGDSVTVSKNYVYAAALGKSVVELFKDGESLGTTVITVKKNATEDTLTITELEDGKEVVCGVEYTVTLPRKGVDTDERRLFVDDKAVEDKEDAPRAYAVKFTKDGDHKVKFEAFQSAELDKATASKEITVKAVMPKPVSAKQVSASSFAVEFEGNMEGLISKDDITNQMIYYTIADTPVVTGVIKSVEVKDKNVTVTMYADFTEGTEVFFKYGKCDAVSFKTAKNDLKEVDHIEIVTTTATVSVAKTLEVKLYNKDNVELSIANPGITFEQLSGTDVAYLVGSNITFFAAGSVNVKATLFIDYDSTTYESIYKEATATITGAVKTTTQTGTAYSFSAATSDAKHAVRLNTSIVYPFNVKYTFSDDTTMGTEAGVTTAMNFNTAEVDGNFKLQSADERVAMISGYTNIKTVATGKTTIILYQYTNNAWTAVGAFPIEVLEKIHGATVTADVTATTYNTNTTVSQAAVKLNVAVKDLDGQAYALTNCKVTVKQLTNNATATGVTLTSVLDKDEAGQAADLTLTFSGTPINTYAPVTFSVTVVDKYDSKTLLEKTLSVAVADVAPTVANSSYKLVADKTSLDASVKYNTNDPVKTATISVKHVLSTSYGDFYLGEGGWAQVVESYAAIPATHAAGTYNFIIKTFPGTKNVVENAGTSFTITNYCAGDNKDNRTVNGSYIVSGYRVQYDTNKTRTGSPASLGQVSVVVTRNDVAPTIALKTSLDAGLERGTATYLKNHLAAPTSVFLATWDGHNSDETGYITLGTITDYVEDATTGAIVVKTVPYTLNIYNNANIITGTIAVNKLFKNE